MGSEMCIRDSTISFTTDGLYSGGLELEATVYHEFAHNWDDPHENRHVGAFRALSDWDMTRDPGDLPSDATGDSWFYSRDAVFARDYGRHNPQEDFATTWETYFLKEYHGVTPGRTEVSEKLANLDRLFRDLA